MIKTLIVGILLLSAVLSAGLHWDKQYHDFGKVKKGSVLNARFVCYNNSDSVLRIEKVDWPCNCTIPSWTKTPVSPGDSAIVNIRFDTEGKKGIHNKYFGVITNLGLFELKIRAEIVKSDE